MAALASVSDFVETLAPPPVVDLAAAAVADDLKGFERMVDKFESDQAAWRATTSVKYRELLEKIRTAGLSKADAASRKKFCEENAPALLATLDDALKVFQSPLHEQPDLAAKLATVASFSIGTARFLRKQLRRVERVRVLGYNTIVDWQYGLLALFSELEPDEERGPTFSDPAELESFIRSSLTG